jgi:hypothetical protein
MSCCGTPPPTSILTLRSKTVGLGAFMSVYPPAALPPPRLVPARSELNLVVRAMHVIIIMAWVSLRPADLRFTCSVHPPETLPVAGRGLAGCPLCALRPTQPLGLPAKPFERTATDVGAGRAHLPGDGRRIGALCGRSARVGLRVGSFLASGSEERGCAPAICGSAGRFNFAVQSGKRYRHQTLRPSAIGNHWLHASDANVAHLDSICGITRCAVELRHRWC